jgi:thiosulfate dehydrogenase
MAKQNSFDLSKWLNVSVSILKGVVVGVIAIVLVITYFVITGLPKFEPEEIITETTPVVMPDSNFVDLWTAPSDWRLGRLDKKDQELIKYGKELIAHTADYLGPNGTVMSISNGLNCQNCHLQGGTQPWGNNYFAVRANYPKLRARSGMVEDQVKRVNDCLERSLNGRGLEPNSHEMRAMLAYLKWLGSDVPFKQTPKGTGIFKLKGLNRPTDPIAGDLVYQQKCSSCHQANGEGMMGPNGRSYTYPPLWGKHSYNNGAGLYRISNFAGWVKLNMPFGTTYKHPQLTDEEAWDVAAYVNSRPRPEKDTSKDWPDITAKPFDHPFGPYADPFTEEQHKYGPYKPIKEWKEKNKTPKTVKPSIARL